MFSLDSVIVNTLAEFKALNIRPNLVVAKGQLAIADGWGGDFVWYPGDTTTADDDNVVQLTRGEAGRYRRVDPRADQLPIVVATLAALKALTSRPESVLVKAGQAAGVWEWELGSSTTADDALVVQCTSGTAGRYKRLYVGPVYVTWFGADTTGVADSAAAIQATVTAVQNLGGGIVGFPPGNYKLTAAIAVTASGVIFAGAGRQASILLFTNASGNSFTFTGVSGTSIYGCGIRDLYVNHTGKSGGDAIVLTYVADFCAERMTVGNAWNGFDCNVINDVTFRNTTWTGMLGAQWGRFRATGADRSDVLTITDSVVNMGGGARDGLVWDGFAHTLRMARVGIISCRYGVWIKNTSASTTSYPTFAKLVACEWDGCTVTSFKMDAGDEILVEDCDMFQAFTSTGPVVEMLADAGVSNTKGLRILGGRYGGATTNIMQLKGTSWSVIGAAVGNGNAAVAAIRVYGTASNFAITNVKFKKVDWTSSALTYGIQLDAGATRSVIGPNDYYGMVTGTVLDNSGVTTNYNIGGIDQAGVPFSNIGTANGTSLTLTGALDVGTSELWGAAGTRGELSYTTGAAIVRAKGTNKLYLNYGDGSGGVEVYDGGGGLVATLAAAGWTQPVDRGLLFTNQTSAAGANTGTLTNAPAAGNPGHWLKIKIGGTSYAIPAWLG